MVLKFGGAYFVLLTLITSSAYSATSASLWPFSAITVKNYLDACKIHHTTCSLEVGTALMDKMDYRGVAKVCLESGYDVQKILDWLVSHPETHPMPTEEGIYLATRALYQCK